MNIKRIVSYNTVNLADNILEAHEGDAKKAGNAIISQISKDPSLVNSSNWSYVIDVLRELEGFES